MGKETCHQRREKSKPHLRIGAWRYEEARHPARFLPPSRCALTRVHTERRRCHFHGTLRSSTLRSSNQMTQWRKSVVRPTPLFLSREGPTKSFVYRNQRNRRYVLLFLRS